MVVIKQECIFALIWLQSERRQTMTNKEAIERLKDGAPFIEIYNKEWEEAISLAIQALNFIEENFPKTFDDYLKGEEE